MQGLLECLDVPYVGVGRARLGRLHGQGRREGAAGAGRAAAGRLPRRAPRALGARRPTTVLAELAALGLPVFVKPARLGSSVGIVRVAEARRAGRRAGDRVRARPARDRRGGRERAGDRVRGARQRRPGRLRAGRDRADGRDGAAAAGWYDYEAKYTPGGMELVVPARIPAGVAPTAFARSLPRRSPRSAAPASRAPTSSSTCETGAVLVNELNTMPGFTETSRLRQALRRLRRAVRGAARPARRAGARAPRARAGVPVLICGAVAFAGGGAASETGWTTSSREERIGAMAEKLVALAAARPLRPRARLAPSGTATAR